MILGSFESHRFSRVIPVQLPEQGSSPEQLWHGNLVAAKVTDDRFTQMIDTSLAAFPSSKISLPQMPLLAATTATGSSSSMLQMPHPTHPSPPSLHATVTTIAAVASPHALHYPAAHQVYFAEQQQPQPVGPIPQAPTSRSTACTAPLTHNIPIKYASSSPLA